VAAILKNIAHVIFKFGEDKTVKSMAAAAPKMCWCVRATLFSRRDEHHYKQYIFDTREAAFNAGLVIARDATLFHYGHVADAVSIVPLPFNTIADVDRIADLPVSSAAVAVYRVNDGLVHCRECNFVWSADAGDARAPLLKRMWELQAQEQEINRMPMGALKLEEAHVVRWNIDPTYELGSLRARVVKAAADLEALRDQRHVFAAALALSTGTILK